MSIRMPFGKFKGVFIHDLPFEYLAWLHALDDLRDPLRSAVQNEFRARSEPVNGSKPLDPGVRAMVEEIVSSGYRRLSQVHHPDHGGETKTMQMVNAAAEWLRATVRGAG